MSKFYVFEGCDGSGKTTISRCIADRLGALWTCEPTVKFSLSDDPIENLYKFALDRYIHNRDVILPALNNDLNVVCDRYYWSSIAYQGYKDMVNLNHIVSLSKPINCPIITAWFVLHPDIDDAVNRCKSRGESEYRSKLIAIDRFYKESLGMSDFNHNIYHIDTKDRTVNDVSNIIMGIINAI